jgi:hypothetical protein
MIVNRCFGLIHTTPTISEVGFLHIYALIVKDPDRSGSAEFCFLGFPLFDFENPRRTFSTEFSHGNKN